MKKAFTLVEMLVVVVVLVTLMTMVFRLGSIGSDSSRLTVTISRMQRLENALSGYYAAFGTYPPVKVHGSRNPYLRVNSHGVQNRESGENADIWGWIDSEGLSVKNWRSEQAAWQQVEAACRSQPIDCQFPFSEDMKPLVDAKNTELQTWAGQSEKMSDDMRQVLSRGFDDGVSGNPRRFAKDDGDKKTEWSDVRLFKFGLLSFLLPRYLVMMQFDKHNGDYFFSYAQWLSNNTMPSDPLTGNKFTSWKRMQEYSQSENGTDLARVSNIPSQAACARWMSAFEKSICCNYDMTIFGVHIKDNGLGQEGGSLPSWDEAHNTLSGEILSPGASDSESTDNQYVLDKVTIRDGWGRDLFYYSPAPHQTYMLWSAGPNGRTFPPWISRDGMSSDAAKCVGYWVRDDISNLSY